METDLNLLHHPSQPRILQALALMHLAIFHYHAGGLAAAAEFTAQARGSYYSVLLSPRDRGRIFTLALELGVEEFGDRLPPLLAPLAGVVEPDLVRLSRHADPKIAAKALELRRGLHRRGLPRLDIRTLGEFRLLLDQEPLDEAVWYRKQPQLLLKALVARGSVNVPQDLILEDLWPQGDPVVTERNFRVSLHRLRKALEPRLDKDFGSSYLHMERGRLSLDRELCRVDVSEFLSCSESAREQEEQGNLPQAIGLYKKAITLYGGDFLPEEPYLPWAETRRKELQAVYLELLDRLSRLYEKQGTLGRAIDCCKKIIQTDPVSEHTYCRLMTLYARRGMRREALRTYEACKEALARELEAKPDAITTAIYRKIEEAK